MLKTILSAFLCLLPFAAIAQPNIVLILVDDFSMNLMDPAAMPNLAQMQADGMTFDNYFVSESLCCPSRASLFTGMLPHNTGVRTNDAPAGGIAAFTAHGDEAKSFAPLLQAGGYKTAFMGKYLNGYDPAATPIPPGWNRWVSTGAGYAGFGYALNDNGVLSAPPDHFTDAISNLGRAWILPVRAPFFLELAPFSPHKPYISPVRYQGSFLTAVMPKTPAYDARPDVNAPQWLQIIPEMKSVLKTTLEGNYVMRLQASKGVDDMIGATRARLEAKGLTGNTVVIFTSDNGYHMGEYSLRSGKMTPFDTDIHVPMIIVGPGIAAGSHNSRIVSNIDIAPTVLELAGLPVPAGMDGQSMFSGPARSMAVVEHLGGPLDPNDPDYTDPKAGEPPTYTALRGAGFMYVEYETGEVGYYDLTADPYELHNVASALIAARLASLHASVAAVSVCAGQACIAAQN